jgi:hypothetical protein
METAVIIGIIIVYLGMSVFLIALINSIIGDYRRSKSTSKFKQSLTLAIKTSQPTWNQIRTIASGQPITKLQMRSFLKELLTESLAGDEGLKAHAALIESYILADQEDEPFDDMPQEIRIHLERLRDQIPNRPELVETLVEHLRDTRIKTVRQKKRQNLINMLSLLLGLIGLIIGIISAFKPSR